MAGEFPLYKIIAYIIAVIVIIAVVVFVVQFGTHSLLDTFFPDFFGEEKNESELLISETNVEPWFLTITVPFLSAHSIVGRERTVYYQYDIANGWEWSTEGGVGIWYSYFSEDTQKWLYPSHQLYVKSIVPSEVLCEKGLTHLLTLSTTEKAHVVLTLGKESQTISSLNPFMVRRLCRQFEEGGGNA